MTTENASCEKGKDFKGSEFLINCVNENFFDSFPPFILHAKDASEMKIITDADVVEFFISELGPDINIDDIDWENTQSEIDEETKAFCENLLKKIEEENFIRVWEKYAGDRRIRILFDIEDYQKTKNVLKDYEGADFEYTLRIINQFLLTINQIRNVAEIIGKGHFVGSLEEIVFKFTKSLEQDRSYMLDVIFVNEVDIKNQQEEYS